MGVTNVSPASLSPRAAVSEQAQRAVPRQEVNCQLLQEKGDGWREKGEAERKDQDQDQAGRRGAKAMERVVATASRLERSFSFRTTAMAPPTRRP